MASVCVTPTSVARPLEAGEAAGAVAHRARCAPRPARSRSAAVTGWKRKMWPTCSTRPVAATIAASAAALGHRERRAASRRSSAARRARHSSARARWLSAGVTMSTASTCGSAVAEVRRPRAPRSTPALTAKARRSAETSATHTLGAQLARARADASRPSGPGRRAARSPRPLAGRRRRDPRRPRSGAADPSSSGRPADPRRRSNARLPMPYLDWPKRRGRWFTGTSSTRKPRIRSSVGMNR